MVDFQSRDTDRGLGSDEENEEENTDKQTTETDKQTTETEEETIATEIPTTAAYAIVTVTADRSISEDSQGDAVVDAVESDDSTVVTRDLVQPGYDSVQSTVSTLADRDDVDVVVTLGGTGVETDDVTIEALDPLFDKQLPGFGELFRVTAHETEGTAVIGTRTTAGIVGTTPVFALPGTAEGALLGIEEIVLPEAPQLAADAGHSV